MKWAVLLALAVLSSSCAAFAAEPGEVLVRVTQIAADGHNLSAPLQMLCPKTGCQIASDLSVASVRISLNTVVTFVAGGAYVALTPLPPGTARIREFAQARPAPVFLPMRTATSVAVLRLEVELAGNAGQSKAALALLSNAEPDAYLKIEFAPPTS
jgi:hypothetical protein